jgi:hypothetical protein
MADNDNKEEENNKTDDNSNKKINIRMTFSLKWAIIGFCAIIALQTLHSILAWCGVSGNFVWFILNLLFFVCGVIVIIFDVILLKKFILPHKDDEIPSLVVNIIALIFASCDTAWWFRDMITNLKGLF